MFKTVFATATLVLAAAPAVAQADDARNFSHEGVDYAYTSEKKGNVTVIEGKASGNVPFRLYVKGDHISGTFNNRYVSFSKADVVRDNAIFAAD
ncbi:hypothetical protein I5E68_15195 [Novosphingobium sp. YJ-S2-02]|uniref:Uncharacterized protein n=1 Tax=Novosphingobium aureum TaxID=2792964 RepID=A0A931HDV4_9SPHN|nr:hypothetical protein [Novosphingobium aureum]MBH0114290.1 hypothetical protein [Novosphingobium aureum]